MINEHTQVKLAGSAHPFLRAANVIQFGADATRTGLVTTDHAEDVAAVLATLRRAARRVLLEPAAGPAAEPQTARNTPTGSGRKPGNTVPAEPPKRASTSSARTER